MTTATTSIVVDEFYPHPIERVWRALTEPAAIARWLMPNDFEPTVGHRFTFRTNPLPQFGFDGVVHCEVTEVEPPRRLAYTWTGGNLDTRVSYELETAQQDGRAGTRLHFEHAGFDFARPNNENAYKGMAGGWQNIGRSIGAVLDELAAAE